MQANELISWINLAINGGILIVAILALIKWSQYVDMNKKEILPQIEKKMSVPKKDESEKDILANPSKVFDQVLRKEDVVNVADSEEIISEEEFYKAVNQKK